MGARSAAQAQGLSGRLAARTRRNGTRSPREAEAAVEAARGEAEARGVADPENVTAHVFYDGEMQQRRRPVDARAIARRASTETPRPEGQRINMVTAIRRTLDHELELNPRVLLFGEDIGPKGGVHAVTLGLQEKYRRSSGCSTPASPRKASSAAPSAWRSPG